MPALYKMGSLALVGAALLVSADAAAFPHGVPESIASGRAAVPHLAIKRLVLAHGIEGHEPQGSATSFRADGERVYAFIELDNATRASDMITVTFQPPKGKAVAEVPLRVGDTQRFRTWAFTRRAREAGEWNVVVKDGAGRTLGRQSFVVTSP